MGYIIDERKILVDDPDYVFARSTSRKNALCDILARTVPTAWVQDGTYTNLWKVDLSFVPYPSGGVKVDGTSFVSTTISDANSNNGRYHYDFETTTLYVNPYTDIFGSQVVVTVFIRCDVWGLAQDGTTYTFEDKYEPRLVAVPNITRKVGASFGTGVQIGSGTITIENADNRFDGYDYSNATAFVRYGADIKQ